MLEIERKFLCDQTVDYENLAVRKRIVKQSYLSTNVDSTVRIRIFGDEAFITIKTKNVGCVRNEWEYAIPKADAETIMAKVCNQGIVEKTRYDVVYEGNLWEIDVFEGKLKGLVLGEIELTDSKEEFVIPPFVIREVTDDPFYYNSNLVTKTI